MQDGRAKRHGTDLQTSLGGLVNLDRNVPNLSGTRYASEEIKSRCSESESCMSCGMERCGRDQYVEALVWRMILPLMCEQDSKLIGSAFTTPSALHFRIIFQETAWIAMKAVSEGTEPATARVYLSDRGATENVAIFSHWELSAGMMSLECAPRHTAQH